MFKKYTNVNGKLVPYIAGGKGCFTAGTVITMASGYTNIEDIIVGCEVLAFSPAGELVAKKVTHTFVHNEYEYLRVKHWQGELCVTPNHWVLTDINTFIEIGNLQVDDALVMLDGSLSPILSIEKVIGPIKVYNLTVEDLHTYIANDVKVHNKGGGKGGGETVAPGVESPNTLFSTDILFVTIALGEGPYYRINPNGPQDIEINEGSIDDLINLYSDGNVNTELFYYDTNNGTLSQSAMGVFGNKVVTPQSLSSPNTLKKGNISGIPRSAVTLQNTSQNDWDSLRFNFSIQSLLNMDSQGNIFAYNLGVDVTVYDSTGITQIGYASRDINGKTNTPFKFNMLINIPNQYKSTAGYKFTVTKTTNDSDSSKIQDVVVFNGWDEIHDESYAYPRTAIIGFAIKAYSEYKGSVPTFTSLVKGLLCKVPSNYNQPIIYNSMLSTWDIDWRELETSSSGVDGYPSRGYNLQKSGSTVLYDTNPKIYFGIWDGTFRYAWTQNPVWILYDLLTNTNYGLGIPEESIDKFKFYKVAQYCDAVDLKTGQWAGVDGYADGTFTHKPKGLFSTIRETLIGLPSGAPIKERRFVCDITIANQKQVMDLIMEISALFRGVLFYSGGKISLNVDLPNELPSAVFNETNIIKDSFQISGIKETEIVTGVEVSYLEPNNHYRREVVRVDNSKALREQNQIENVKTISLSGCTRRSQAIRFAQYIIASSKYIRRKIQFKVLAEAINLTIGEIVAVSQRQSGTNWGYGGRTYANSTIGTSNVFLEHFTSPAITAAVFTANTNPIGLRVLKAASDRVDLYLLSNVNVQLLSTSNVNAGYDRINVNVTKRFNNITKLYDNYSAFTANTVVQKGDIWTLGEVNPSNYYSGQNDKLFKITGMERDKDEQITIFASEYVSNVYTDSDTLINYIPVKYEELFSPMIPPPPPMLNLVARPTRQYDGSVQVDLEVNASTDLSGYPIAISTDFEIARPLNRMTIEEIF